MGRKRRFRRENPSPVKQSKSKMKTETENQQQDIYSDLFTLEIHHQGMFTSPPNVEYVGGKVNLIDGCNKDKWSLLVLDECARKLGYPADAGFGWYGRLPGLSLEQGLFYCLCDRDCQLLVNTLPPNRVVEVYLAVVGGSTGVRFVTDNIPNPNEATQSHTNPSEDVGLDKDSYGRDSDVIILEEGDGDGADDEVDMQPPMADIQEPINDGCDLETSKANPGKEADVGVGISMSSNEVGIEERVGIDETREVNMDKADLKNTGEQDEQNAEGAAACEGRIEDEDNGVNADDKLADSDYEDKTEDNDLLEEVIQLGQHMGGDIGAREADQDTRTKQRKKKPGRKRDEDSGVNCCDDQDTINIDGMQSDYDSDESLELKSQTESDDDGCSSKRRPKFPIFNEKTDMKRPKLVVGQKFTTVMVFRLAVRIQAIMDGRDVYFKKNDTQRVRVKCRGCDWELLGSKMQGESTFQIKTLSEEHTCGRVFHNKNMTSRLASKLFIDEVRKAPSMTVHELMNKVTEELNVEFSLKQGYRTLKKVRDTIQGSHEKQYTLLEDFCGEIRRANPGSTVFVETDMDDEGVSRFKRLYMCIEPIKRGFLAGCRHWIGLDGCFLKGPYGGQLLSAIGVDGDNKMFPLALAVVGVENFDNWSWFLGLLVQDLDISDSSTWCIMTDKQKGLLQAVRDKFPHAEHRCCVQHLYTNFKQHHRGLALKERLWRCAKASYMNQFKSEMELMKQESKDAFEWLAEKDPHNWSRAHFKDGLDCDILVNNMCESFNAVILKARGLPIIGMLQTIYLYLLRRMEKNRETMSKHEGLLCPAIFDILEKAKTEQCTCISHYAGTNKYQICCPFGEQFVVDMGTKTCTCRKWQLRGIPCGHAVAAINRRREKPEKNVAATYLKSTYMKTYKPVLNPINGPHLWDHKDVPPMKPPNIVRSVGRPKKMRKKRPNEESQRQSCVNPSKPHKVSKVGTKMSCSICKKYGHNKRSCPEKHKQAESFTHDDVGPLHNESDGTSTQPKDATRFENVSKESTSVLNAADMAQINTQESHTDAPQDLRQQSSSGRQTVRSNSRKCSFCRKPGHSKKGCQLRQWTFRNSLDMTGELGLNNGVGGSDNIINPFQGVQRRTETGHLSSKPGVKIYSHSPGVTMKAPDSYINERETIELGSSSHRAKGLEPTTFTWKGKMCVNLSTLQAAAGHSHDSTGLGNVQIYGDGNEAAKLGNLSSTTK